MKISGIYKIINNKTGKVYIGQSLDVKDRIRHHRYLLKKGTHINSYLLNSYNIHGSENFSYKIIFSIKDKSITKKQIIQILNKKEQYYINKFDSFKNGYNLTSGGNNKIFCKKSIEKMKKSHLGQNFLYLIDKKYLIN